MFNKGQPQRLPFLIRKGMIRQQINLEKHNWKIRVYYYVDSFYTDEILKQLAAIGCEGEFMQTAQVNLSRGELDSGLAYSNPKMRKSVMVIARTSSAMEFACSQQHEVGHIKSSIAKAENYPQEGEELQYIGDEIYKAMWPIAKQFLCDCCRHKEE